MFHKGSSGLRVVAPSSGLSSILNSFHFLAALIGAVPDAMHSIVSVLSQNRTELSDVCPLPNMTPHSEPRIGTEDTCPAKGRPACEIAALGQVTDDTQCP